MSTESKTILDKIKALLTGETVADPAAKLQGDLTAALGEISTLKQKLTLANIKLATVETPEQREEAIGREVNRRLATVGGAPIRRDPALTGGGGDIIEQWQAISDPTQKRAFYEAHRLEIQEAMDARKSGPEGVIKGFAAD